MFHNKNIYFYLRIILAFLLFYNSSISAQNVYDTAIVDTVAIKYRKGFVVDDFIQMTKADTSFYRAFKNLKMFPHISNNEIEIFTNQSIEMETKEERK